MAGWLPAAGTAAGRGRVGGLPWQVVWFLGAGLYGTRGLVHARMARLNGGAARTSLAATVVKVGWPRCLLQAGGPLDA
jgi:hypothetical protein